MNEFGHHDDSHGHHRNVGPRDLFVALAVLSVAVTARLTVLAPDDPPASTGPHLVEAVAQRFRGGAADVAVGSCLTGSVDDVQSEVHVVDCAEPHLAEVVAVVTHPADPRAPYPSTLGWSSFFTAACSAPTEAYLGRPAAGATDVFNDGFAPTPEQWRVADDRIALCTVEVGFEPDGSRTPVSKPLGAGPLATQ